MKRRGRLTRLAALTRCAAGAVVIETAIAAPILALLALGTFDLSKIVARQMELQSCAHQAEELALASNWGANNDVNVIATILAESFDLRDDQIDVAKRYRCQADGPLIEDSAACGEDVQASAYVQITLRDTYQPLWTQFGIGSAHSFDLVRLVRLS